MLKTLFRYFGPHKKLFLIDMSCAFAVAIVDLAFPLVSRKAMYDMLPDKLYGAFFTVMAIVAVSYLLRSFFYYIMTYWGHTFGVRVEADIRADLFYHLQDLDFSFYDQNRTGKLMSRLTGDLFEITELAHHGPEDAVIASLTIIGALCFMFTIEWRLALVVAIILPIFILLVMQQRRDMARTSKDVKQNLATISSDIESCLSGIRTSKAFANEEVDQERFDASNDLYKGAKKNYYKAMGRFMASQELAMGFLPVAVMAFGGWLMMRGLLNYVDLLTFALFISTFVTPIRKLCQFAEVFANGMTGLSRFSEVMAIQPEVTERPDARPLTVAKGAIALEDISFSYNGISEVLNHVSLSVRGGETVAIVGHSGGGKTTLCQLIPRFYDVTEGTIAIDGMDIRQVTKKSLRQNIGIVQQDVFIFADTILENIRYGRPDATMEEVYAAARQAEIYEDIMDMPDGFQTYVGERGTKLSGGQKQRISIARIFLKDPKILILDEATSALDTITEQKIQESFDQLSRGRTTLVIAHRLATVKNADRIVLIDDGKIAEAGTHQELLEKNGGYAKLYHTQKLMGTAQ